MSSVCAIGFSFGAVLGGGDWRRLAGVIVVVVVCHVRLSLSTFAFFVVCLAVRYVAIF